MRIWKKVGVLFFYLALVGGAITIYAGKCTSWDLSAITSEDRGPYGQLADAFMAGQLSLLIHPDPSLDKISDPYRHRGDASFLWDYSYFRTKEDVNGGKYYLYWGPVPALIANAPWKIMTGSPLNQRLSLLLIVSFSVVSFAILLRLLVIFYFEDVPLLWQGFILILYAICNLQPWYFNNPCIYFTAVAYAATILMTSLCFLVLAMQNGRYRLAWQFLFSLFVALSIGCRISYLLTAMGLVIYWLYRGYVYEGRGAVKQRSFWIDFETLFIPVISMVLALLWYNYARFGTPFENGMHYLLNNDDNGWTNPFFALKFWGEGIWTYAFGPWSLKPTFPYIDPQCSYTPSFLISSGRSYSETAVGSFLCFPICFFSFAWPFLVRRLPAAIRAQTMVIGAVLSFNFLALFLLMADYYAICFRYIVDFQIPLLVLTSFSLLAYRQVRGPLPIWQLVLIGIISAYGLAVGTAINFYW